MTNPFESERGSYLVILNAAGQASLWPDFLTVPPGWQPVHGPAGRCSSARFIDALPIPARPAGTVWNAA